MGTPITNPSPRPGSGNGIRHRLVFPTRLTDLLKPRCQQVEHNTANAYTVPAMMNITRYDCVTSLITPATAWHDHAAQGTSMATQTHHRADGTLREHIRCSRENIRRESLVRPPPPHQSAWPQSTSRN